MNVLIFGLGTLGGGFAAAKYFLDQGDAVRITDLRSESVLGTPLGILKSLGAETILQEHRQEDFLWADVVIKNPAVPANNPLLSLAKRIETDITFLFSSPLVQNIHIIAITGTKGKTTTAAAVAHVLNTGGHESLQCGNMGISGFSILLELQSRLHKRQSNPEYLVCELSSWQIRDMYTVMGKSLPQFRMVVLTSLFPDHLNSYGDINAYKQDKWLLLSSKSKLIVLSAQVYDEVKANVDINNHKLIAIENIPGVKKIEARFQPAWAICRKLSLPSKLITEALASFRGVPHRQEQIAMTGNFVFINDSAATIPEAVVFSTASLPWHYVLICGGTDKNLDAVGMLKALQRALSIHVLDGSFSQNKLIPLLKEQQIPYFGPFGTMKEAFDSAVSSAKQHAAIRTENPIISILLSPGAASFVLFKHEFDRGDQFRALALQYASESL